MKISNWLLLLNPIVLGLATLIYPHDLLPVSYAFTVCSFLILLMIHWMEHTVHLNAVLESYREPFGLSFQVLPKSPTYQDIEAGSGVSIVANLNLITAARMTSDGDGQAELTLTFKGVRGPEDRKFLVRQEIASAVVRRVDADRS